MNIPENKLVTAKKDCRGIAKIIWIYVLVDLIFSVVYTLFDKIYSFSESTGAILSLLLSVLSIGSAILYAHKKYRFNIRKEQFSFNFSPSLVFMMLLVICGLNLINSLIMNVITYIFGVSTAQEMIYFGNDTIYDITMFITIVIVAPILEELMFRGAILKILDRYHHNFAIISSAALFAMLHGSLAQWAYAFALGIILAYLALKYDSLLLTMTIHALNNLLSVITMILYDSPFVYAIIFFMFCGVFATVFLMWQNKHKFRLVNDLNYPFIRYTFFNPYMICLILFNVILLFVEMFKFF